MDTENIREKEEKIGYRQILTQKEYCKLIVANLINRFGDSVDALAFTWLVYQVTGSASWSAIIYALNMLPTILLQPFAGAAVERRSKKRLMILADILRGVVVVTLAVSYLTGIVNPWIMAAFTLIISSVEAFCSPASTAIIPKLLERKYFEFGTSLNSVASRVMELIGTAAAGIIIGVAGIGAAILIDATTFFISALIKTFLHVEEKLEEKSAEAGTGGSRYLQDLKEGFTYVKSKQIIMNFCIMAFLVNAMMVPINSFQSPLVMDVLGQGSGLLSAMGVALVIGMGIATVIFPYISQKLRVRTIVCGNGICLGFFVAMMTLGSHFTENTVLVYAVTALCSFGLGFSVDLLNCAVSVQFMKCVEENYLARASALLGAGATAAMPLTSFFLSILVKYISVKEIIVAGGAICAMIFIVIWLKKVQMEVEEQDETKNSIEEAY